jgi:hypothetical protein
MLNPQQQPPFVGSPPIGGNSSSSSAGLYYHHGITYAHVSTKHDLTYLGIWNPSLTKLFSILYNGHFSSQSLKLFCLIHICLRFGTGITKDEGYSTFFKSLSTWSTMKSIDLNLFVTVLVDDIYLYVVGGSELTKFRLEIACRDNTLNPSIPAFTSLTHPDKWYVPINHNIARSSCMSLPTNICIVGFCEVLSLGLHATSQHWQSRFSLHLGYESTR